MTTVYNADFYKVDHRRQYPEGTEFVYSNLTPRGSRVAGVDEVVFFGLQYFIMKYLIDDWNNNFFIMKESKVVDGYEHFINTTLGKNYVGKEHIRALHQLGYLPIRIRAIKEGMRCPMRVACLTIENTHPDFFWLTNFFETILSTTLWGMITSATTSYQFRKTIEKYRKKTVSDTPNFFTQLQSHDFSMRGMFGLEAAQMSGAGHLTSFVGTDTIPAIHFLTHYYGADIDKELVGTSVGATEHSVMCLSTAVEGEFECFKRLLTETYPEGIVSIVSDSFDFWKVINEFLPALKETILSRNGKLVIRPDCLDEESQILTPSGWKHFRDLTLDDEVAQVHEDGTYDFVNPSKITNVPYEGDMYHIRDFYGKVDLMVTPNHRLVSFKSSNKSLSIVEAANYKQNYWEYQKLRSPKSKTFGNGLTNFERFLIALQADGTIRYKTQDGGYKVEFNFQKARKHNRLLSILSSLDFEYSVSYPKSRDGQSTFNIHIPNKYAISKDFSWVNTSNLTYSWSLDFMEELSNWDSSKRSSKRFKFDTTNKSVVDVVELVAIASGKGVLISEYEDNRSENFSKIYTANITNNPYIGGQALTKTKVNYKGNVYCVTVPTGMILVKRGRGVCVTGNSGDPVKIVSGYKVDTWEDAWAGSECVEHEGKYYTVRLTEINRSGFELDKELTKSEVKGLIECLWDTFGGTWTEKGYKLLDEHIGMIYGDSITLDRLNQIMARLEEKGFASFNFVSGTGSFTYQYVTRDTFGFAVKATAAIVNGKEHLIYKQPKTDDGTKNSAKGFLKVDMDITGRLYMTDNLSQKEAEGGLLEDVFINGKLVRKQTLSDIRKIISDSLE